MSLEQFAQILLWKLTVSQWNEVQFRGTFPPAGYPSYHCWMMIVQITQFAVGVLDFCSGVLCVLWICNQPRIHGLMKILIDFQWFLLPHSSINDHFFSHQTAPLLCCPEAQSRIAHGIIPEALAKSPHGGKGIHVPGY